MSNCEVRIIKFDTSFEMKRNLAGQHNRAQHSGRESSVPRLLNNFLQLAAEGTRCNKTVVTLIGEADCEVRQHGDNRQANEASCPYAPLRVVPPLRTHSAGYLKARR